MAKLSDEARLLADKVEVDELRRHAESIARWERLSGSEDELKAFQYIKGELDALGYKTSLVRNDALISLPRSAKLTVDGLGAIECITHSMAISAEGLRGEILYCGAGQPADYARVDVRGKIALVEGIAMPSKVKNGEDAGAIAQIHISGEQLHEMCVSTVWGSPTPENVDGLPHTAHVSIRTAAGEQIRSLLSGGPVSCEMTTVVDTRYVPIPTLTADFLGSQEPEQLVLFSGHVDSWYFGAMDNGSANATMLEVARVVARHGAPRRTLRMAFWSGHSHGRYAGSAWYVDNHWEELYDRCVAHVNVDSTGGKGATVLSEGPAASELRGLARTVISALAGQEFEGSRVPRAGDHSFIGVGIPAMFMDLSQQPAPLVASATSNAFALLAGGGGKSGGLGWWWHTPHDTLDKLDYDLLVRDTRIYAAVLAELLNSPALPIDLRATAAELRAILNDYQQKAEGRFDLSAIVARAEGLQLAMDGLYSAVEGRGGNGPAVTAFNRGVIEASRVLTVLNYTERGAFEHDTGKGQAPIPLLASVGSLASAEVGSAEYQRVQTALIRRRNAVAHYLRQAEQIVAATSAAIAQA